MRTENLLTLLVGIMFISTFSTPALAVLYSSNCSESSNAKCSLTYCELTCGHTKWLSSNELPGLSLSGNKDIKEYSVSVQKNINHPITVCNKCTWTEKAQDAKNLSYDRSITGENCGRCGSTTKDNYYLDWVDARDTKEVTKDGWIWDSIIVKYKFDIPMKSSGKFNIDIQDPDGTNTIDPWWSSSWSYCRDIMIDQTSEALTNFPVMLLLNSTNFEYSKANTTGQDVRIVNAGCGETGTETVYGIEKWNITGNSYVWFNATTSSSAATNYSIYYGNAVATTTANMTGVWDSNTLAVYLMNESSGYYNDSSASGMVTTYTTVAQRLNQTVGIVDGHGNFSAATNKLNVTTATAIDVPANGNFTVSLIFNNKGVGGTGYIVERVGKWYLAINEDNPGAVRFHTYGSPAGITDTAGRGYNSSVQYLTAVRNNNTESVYLNGTFENSAAGSTSALTGGVLDIGGQASSGYVAGIVDSVFISNVARSAGWINATYYNELNNFLLLGAEEASGSGPQWANNTSSTPATYNRTLLSLFNITWDTNITSVNLTANFTGTSAVYSMTNATYTGSIYNLSRILPAGAFSWSSTAANGTGSNTTDTWSFTIAKASNTLGLTSSNGWNLAQGTSTTINCSDTNQVGAYYGAYMTKDGINVSNPYTAVLGQGSYVFYCYANDTQNYSTSSTYNTLNILPSTTGCTNTTTYGYTSTIDGTSNITLNFTTLVAQGVVKSDLNDVYLETTNATIKKNVTGGYYITVNASNVTSFTIKFGNYYINNSLTLDNRNASTTGFTYSQEAPYLLVFNTINEMNTTMMQPPGAYYKYVNILCAAGSTIMSVNNTTDTTFFTALYSQPSMLEYMVQYNATSQYYRDLLVTAETEYKNMYVVDATLYEVVQYIINLQDNSLTFTNPILHIQKMIGNQLVTITERPFDAENKVIAYLVNGQQYSVSVSSGTNTRTLGNIYVDNRDTDKTITIGDIITTNTTLSDMSYSRTYNSTTGVYSFSWNDPSNHTLNTTLIIYNYTNTSQVFYNLTSSNSSNFYATYTVPDVNGTYVADVHICHSDYGCQSIGGREILGPMVIWATTIATQFENLGIGNIKTILLCVGGIFLMMVPMVFGANMSGVAGIVTALMAVFMAYIGLYPVSVAFLAIVVVIAFLNRFSQKRHEYT